VRVGVPRTWLFDVCDPEIATAVDGAVDAIAELGASVVEIELPHVHLAEAIGRTIVTVEAASLREATLDRVGEYDRDLAARHLSAQFVSALDYARSLRLRRLVEQDFAAALERVDVIVTPTSVVVAPPADDLRSGVGARTVAWHDVVARTTYPVSLAGLPALSTPVGFTSAGLPIGAQIVAPDCATSSASAWRLPTNGRVRTVRPRRRCCPESGARRSV
jgi:aspartyl-tRNA(Asn)/glutamyl-tRNA(Gln) amidotransferase subunit A